MYEKKEEDEEEKEGKNSKHPHKRIYSVKQN